MPAPHAMRPVYRQLLNLTQRNKRNFTLSPRISLPSPSSTSPPLNDSPSRLPRVANPSLWASLVPKPLRRSTATPKPAKTKQRNPYTIFIILGIVIGSNAINTIALRNDMLNFTRKTDAWLERLREVVQQLKRGEDVDVKKLLGTRNAGSEKEWEDVMNEIEQSDTLWEGRVKREEKVRQQKAEEEKRREEKEEYLRRRREEDEEAEKNEDKGSRPKFMM